MDSFKKMTSLPYLSLIFLLWSQNTGIKGQEFQFGHCRVKGVIIQELWEAFHAMKDIVQSQDNITSVRLLQKEVLQNVSDDESCYFIQDLLKFYLNTIFRNYYHKATEFGILKPFSALANNFMAIKSKLRFCQENRMFSTRESAHRQFLLFRGAFKQMDTEAAMIKALGEMDILLVWMGKFYQH